jgi:hypothetical protein
MSRYRLPDGFDTAAWKDLGVKIIQAFVRGIGGELRFGPCGARWRACFAISFV